MHKMPEVDFEKLSVPERIIYLQDLWDRVAAEPDELELTEAQRAELDRRLAGHAAHPEVARPWDEVRDGIRSKR